MIVSKESLIDKISEDYVWRIKEISDLKTLVQQPTTSTQRKNVICRSGVAVLYAHWEGFIKKSGTYFLEYIANQRHCFSELKSNFITLVVKKQVDAASCSRKYSAFEEVTHYVLKNQNKRARIPVKNVVDTQSNLSSSVLKEIIWCLGLEYGPFESAEKMIDIKLVKRRNFIAHGEFVGITPEDFYEMIEEVVQLLNTFKTLIENSAVNESYKASPQ